MKNPAYHWVALITVHESGHVMDGAVVRVELVHMGRAVHRPASLLAAFDAPMRKLPVVGQDNGAVAMTSGRCKGEDYCYLGCIYAKFDLERKL